MSFKLNDQQESAVYKGLNWYYLESHKKQMFNVCGYAGSGKSTTLKFMIEAMGLSTNSVLYVALTGKAVSVLRMKGHMASTIHRAFYNAKPYKNTVFFSKKQTIPSNIKLIVIDEFGMVEDKMTLEILSFGIPVMTLSDNKQLPPVFGKNTFIDEDDKIDVFLDKVMRTDNTSGILDIAMDFRLQKIPKIGTYGRSRVIESKDDCKDMLEYDKVLCWTNKTRRYLNTVIRSELGITDRYPVKGEKIMFLGNRYDKFIEYIGIEICLVNGMECWVLENSEIIDEYQIRVKARPTFLSEDDDFFDVIVNRRVFDAYCDEGVPDTKTLMILDKEEERDSVFCDFAHCGSVHSSQGSEWQNILVIGEMPEHRPEFWKWAYTAATRASYSLDYYFS